MATLIERKTSNGARRLYVVFWATDRDTGKKKKVWELQPSSGGKKAANLRKGTIENLLHDSGGIWPAEEQKPTEEPLTVSTYSAHWLDRHAGKVSERVTENYRRAFRVHLNPRLGSLRLDEVRRRHVNQLVAELVEAGMGRNTIRNNLAPLRRMFRDALDDELVTANPAVNIEISEQAPVREANVPSLEELGKILAAADSEDTREAITVMAGLGLRRGECFALRWGDVDFAENLVTVRATNHRARIKERPKTKAGKRLVPLFPSARQALEGRKRRLGVGLHPDRLVFTNEIGGAVDPGNWYRRCWKKALKGAGLEDRFHVHDVRHFALTALDEQGMKGKLRSEVVGHADENITNSIYTKIRRERVAAAADLYDPLVAGESA